MTWFTRRLTGFELGWDLRKSYPTTLLLIFDHPHHGEVVMGRMVYSWRLQGSHIPYLLRH